MKSWDEAEKGTTLIVKRRYRKRAFRMLVESIEHFSTPCEFAWVVGVRLQMDGTPSKLRRTPGLGHGLRRELVNLEDASVATD